MAALLPIAKAANAPTTVINAVASKTYGFAFATALKRAWAIVAALVAIMPLPCAAVCTVSAAVAAVIWILVIPKIKFPSAFRAFATFCTPLPNAIAAISSFCASAACLESTPKRVIAPTAPSKAPEINCTVPTAVFSPANSWDIAAAVALLSLSCFANCPAAALAFLNSSVPSLCSPFSLATSDKFSLYRCRKSFRALA